MAQSVLIMCKYEQGKRKMDLSYRCLSIRTSKMFSSVFRTYCAMLIYQWQLSTYVKFSMVVNFDSGSHDQKCCL